MNTPVSTRSLQEGDELIRLSATRFESRLQVRMSWHGLPGKFDLALPLPSASAEFCFDRFGAAHDKHKYYGFITHIYLAKTQ